MGSAWTMQNLKWQQKLMIYLLVTYLHIMIIDINIMYQIKDEHICFNMQWKLYINCKNVTHRIQFQAHVKKSGEFWKMVFLNFPK